MKELEYPFNSQYILQKQKVLKRELMKNAKDYPIKKIAILGGATIGILQDILELFLLNHGLQTQFYQSNYNRYYEEGSFGTEELNRFCPDIVYFHISIRNLLEWTEKDISKKDYQLPKAKAFISHLIQSIKGVRTRYNCIVIINNFELPPFRVMGNADCYDRQGEIRFIQEVNQELVLLAEENKNIYINDLNYESAYYGLEKWFDYNLWCLSKYPYAMDAIPYVAFNISNIIKSIYGKNKKLIVLDLDQTLWGGIIGEDGMENICIGSETSEGIVYSDFQKYLKKLTIKGVALAVCSKNEDDIAKRGFCHSGNILTLEDFVSFKANWKEKSYNIKEIAQELNILFDSIVFVDDNPAEREEVAINLPDIKILPIKEAESYCSILDQSGYFEITSITEEDLKRNDYYRQNKLHNEEIRQYKDYKEYLHSLNMAAHFSKITDSHIIRATQLINKTNQFNMTTKRLTESELKDYLTLEKHYGLCASLQDKFGDNGIVTIVLYYENYKCLVIENWLMSCRVFQRGLEFVVFEELINFCRKENLTEIIGFFQKNNKNKIVYDFYKTLGFEFIQNENGIEKWKLKIDNYQNTKNFIEVKGKLFYE